jgi:hypothetical protein
MHPRAGSRGSLENGKNEAAWDHLQALEGAAHSERHL